MKKNIFKKILCVATALTILSSSSICTINAETKNETSAQSENQKGTVIRELMDSIQTDWWTMKEKYPEMNGGGSGAWQGTIDSFPIEGHEGSFKGCSGVKKNYHL